MILQVILNGIFLGAIYVNIAVGFSLAWGVMDVINVAHGTMIVIGAFITFTPLDNPVGQLGLNFFSKNLTYGSVMI